MKLIPNSGGAPEYSDIRERKVQEEWSDAARAAAAAARKARGRGLSKTAQNIALKKAYLKKGGKLGRPDFHKGDWEYNVGVRTSKKGRVLKAYSWDEGKAEGENVYYKRVGKRGWKLYRNRSSSDSMPLSGRIGSRAIKRSLRQGTSSYMANK